MKLAIALFNANVQEVIRVAQMFTEPLNGRVEGRYDALDQYCAVRKVFLAQYELQQISQAPLFAFFGNWLEKSLYKSFIALFYLFKTINNLNSKI